MRTDAIQLFDEPNVPRGMEQLEHDGNRRAHYAAANNDNACVAWKLIRQWIVLL